MDNINVSRMDKMGNYNRITIKESTDIFIKAMQVEGKAENTIKSYRTDMDIFYQFVKSHLNNKLRYVNDIKYVHLEMFKDYIYNEYHFSTACRKYNCIRSYIRVMDRLQHIDQFIVKRLETDKFGNQRKDKNSKITKIRNGVMSDETKSVIIQRIQEDNSNNKYRDLALIHILNHGLRRSEVLSLKWNDFDFYKKTMNIFRTKNSTFDIVTISSEALDSLEKYFRVSSLSSTFSNKVFDLSTTPYNNIIKKYSKGLFSENGHKITGHSFRHSFITNMIRKGQPLSKIQKYVGVTLETLELYIHLNYKDTEDIAKLI